MFRPTDESRDQRYGTVILTGQDDAPPYAALQVTGFDEDTDHPTVSQPDADSIIPALIVFNGPGEIKAGQEGRATRHWPARARYEGEGGSGGSGSGAGDEPANGEPWGTAAGQWELQRDQTGFIAWGGADNGSAVFVADTGTAGEPTSGSGAAGECCNSGVTLRRFRCNGGQLQYTKVCTRLETGHFLNRDEHCRVMLGECGCSQGSVLVYEYEFDPSLTDPLIVTRLALSRECGTLVLRKNDAQDCPAMPERAVFGTGVKIKTLVCRNGAASPDWEYLTLECGKIKRRDADGNLLPDLCCDAPTDCIRTSDGPTWHDAGCPCVGATCGNGLLPQQLDFTAFGQAGTGCDGLGDVGLATWTADTSAAFPGNSNYGPGSSYQDKPGWIFNFTIDGHPVVLAFVCMSGTESIPGFPFGIWAVHHTIDGTADGTEGPTANISTYPTADPTDAGHIEFVLDWTFAGLPCHGGMNIVARAAS